MAWKVLVTARAFWSSGPEAYEQLLNAGCEVVKSDPLGPLTVEQLIPRLEGCDAVIASSDAYTPAVFAACPQLKIVSRWGVGIDSVDMAAATEAGVVGTNTPGAMTEAVADYTFGLMLSIARRIPEGEALVRSGGWGEFPGVLVYGKTIGLVGAGMIGQAVARRAAGFGMRILAFDPPRQASPTPDMPAMEFVTLEALYAESDFVCIHVPNLPETKGMFDAKVFAQMKPTAFLINTARGALVNEVDLLAALESGQIAGAAIDVFANEPLPVDHPLRKAPRSVLTPHNAFNAFESTQTMSQMAVDNVLTLMRGERPVGICNPDVWDSPARRA